MGGHSLANPASLFDGQDWSEALFCPAERFDRNRYQRFGRRHSRAWYRHNPARRRVVAFDD
jgi:hypothetical protein